MHYIYNALYNANLQIWAVALYNALYNANRLNLAILPKITIIGGILRYIMHYITQTA